MAFTLEIKEVGSVTVLLVTVSGALCSEITSGIVRQAVEMGRPEGVARALFDLRETWLEDSFLDVHNFMLGLQELGVSLSDQVAIVYKNDPEHHEHAENVAFNRGFSRMRYFKELDDAWKWLADS